MEQNLPLHFLILPADPTQTNPSQCCRASNGQKAAHPFHLSVSHPPFFFPYQALNQLATSFPRLIHSIFQASRETYIPTNMWTEKKKHLIQKNVKSWDLTPISRIHCVFQEGDAPVEKHILEVQNVKSEQWRVAAQGYARWVGIDFSRRSEHSLCLPVCLSTLPSLSLSPPCPPHTQAACS